MLNISWGASLSGVPCCALELEQEIERLEAEAHRDELVTFCLEPAGPHKCLSDDMEGMQDQSAHLSDAESGDADDQEEGGEKDGHISRIRQNALLVSRYGKTLQAGAWRGCAKSPLCDREDRHRGLCNHRATIPGPAACPLAASAQRQDDGEDTDQDTSHMDEDVCDMAACGDVPMQPADEQQVSGGHSHNCQVSAFMQGDEREVDSALQTGDLLLSAQHSTTQAQLQQEAAAAAAAAALAAPVRSSSSAEDDLFWAGNAGQLAAAELFSIPAAFQPRVKDLNAADASCFLGMDSLCDIATPLTAPMTVPLATPAEEQAHLAAALDSSTCSDCSDHTHDKPCAGNSGSSSAPSSPSCASAGSADPAVFGPFQAQVMVSTTSADAATASPAGSSAASEEAQAAAASSPSTPESCQTAAAAFAAAMDSAADLTAAEAAAQGAVTADATHAEPDSAAEATEAAAAVPAEAAAPVSTAVSDSSSAQAELEQAAADAAAAEAAAAASTAAAAAAAAALAASGMGPAAAAPAPANSLAGLQRPPRIKSKPSNTLMKAAAAVEASSSSPKSKKRPAARLASNPSSGHCCTSCGAVSTPVWRAGPGGPKTLCNACGVRWMKVAKRK